MIRRLGPLAVALMLAALFAIGCGDDNKGSSGGSSGGGTSTQSSGGSSSGGGTDVSDNPQVKAAVESCKQSIDSNPAVKENVKGDLEAICDKAASGNADDVKKAIKEVCEKIVESTVPSGAAQDQAKAACASAGG